MPGFQHYDNCEIYPIEDFFSNLAYVSGEQPINIGAVIIKDTAEPECGRYVLSTYMHYRTPYLLTRKLRAE